MTELLTAAQMRAIEQAAIESGEVTGLELMERAGRGVVEAVFEEWPQLADGPHRAVVLCGPGNNGGDGFVVARLLKERGWEVEVFLYGDPETLPPDARVNFERWEGMGETYVLNFPELSQDDVDTFTNAAYSVSSTELVVDALFGTGLARPITGLRSLLELNDLYATFSDMMPVRTVAIDLPSGLCSDSGKVICNAADEGMPWTAFQADLTVSFHALKMGHVLEPGPLWCGKPVVKSIGIKGSAEPEVEALRPLTAAGDFHAVEPDDVATLTDAPRLGRIGKRGQDHKYSHGHALVLTGGAGKTGAARLAARGALRIGAGLVTLGVPPSALQEVACQVTALMMTPVADGDALAETLEDTRISALCLGPGLGLDHRAAGLVARALGIELPDRDRQKDGGKGPVPEFCQRPTLLDADALTLMAQHPHLFSALHEKCVLTPHAGEFKRLFPDIAERLNAPATKGPAYSKVDATRDAARRAGCVVLFKGPDTVIAEPDGRCSVHAAVYDRAAPWLATAGSGDVLSGFIAGLLARGISPMQAAESATWLHVECACRFGPGLIAEDLPEMLPKVFLTLEG